MFCFIGREACGILASQPGMEPTLPALEGRLLTTGLPGKSQPSYSYLRICEEVKAIWNKAGNVMWQKDWSIYWKCSLGQGRVGTRVGCVKHTTVLYTLSKIY